MPLSPQQKYIVDLMTEYLEDKVNNPHAVALDIWRMTRAKQRPRRRPPVEMAQHEHKWIDATNKVITSGEVCFGCGSIRSDNKDQVTAAYLKAFVRDGRAT